MWRSFLVQRRARSARNLEARVSRLIGKFDSTARGLPWQVAFWVPSPEKNQRGRKSARKKGPKRRSGTPPWSGAPALALVTGLPNNGRQLVATGPTAVTQPAWRFMVADSCRVLRFLGLTRTEVLSACYITGTLDIAIGVPFPCD